MARFFTKKEKQGKEEVLVLYFEGMILGDEAARVAATPMTSLATSRHKKDKNYKKEYEAFLATPEGKAYAKQEADKEAA